MTNNGVIAVEKSSNSKLGNVSASYVSQASCPISCPFMGAGCYAESGMVGIHTNRLNKADRTASELARAEAKAIRSLSGKRPLRLHVVGDCKTNKIASTVSEAAKDYSAKKNQPVWAYTHGWKTVDRKYWNNVSILASTETGKDAKAAMKKGYAAAIVVRQHKDTKLYKDQGIKLLPCPQQTGKTTSCETCRLCWNDKYLRDNKIVIAFETHSQQAKKADQALVQIGV
jgi:hypothetical protein